MTASRLSHPPAFAAHTLVVSLALVVAVSAWGCAPPHHDDDAPSLTAVSGEFLADGSCRVIVSGAPLFSATAHPRTTYDAGPVADVAPAGYALHQVTCAPSDADPARQSERNADERMVIVTLYAREGAALRAGRYSVREALATTDDTASVAARAGVAVFGAPAGSHDGNDRREAKRAGVRYLEGRSGTLTIASVSRDANGEHVIGTFSARASPAWSM